MKFTKIPEKAFQNLQLNAGVLLTSFTPSSATLSANSILGATNGGVNFNAVQTFTDFADGVDNAKLNMKEFKRLETWDVKMSGTFVSVDTALVQKLIGAAETATADGKITPRGDLKSTDFFDLWWVGDYSDINDDKNGGFIAIHMMNTLSTGGFQLQSGNFEKGQFAFEFMAHYSNASQDTVPFEVYVKAGTAATTGTTTENTDEENENDGG